MGIRDRIQHAWNAFSTPNTSDPIRDHQVFGSGSYGNRADGFRSKISNEKSLISSIYMRLGVDVAQIYLRHIRRDDNNRYVETLRSGLNECLSVEANMDQAGTAFRLDMAATLFDKGVIAIVPVQTSHDPIEFGGYDIRELRVGTITTWYPGHVAVSVYNQLSGRREELVLPKKSVAIVENPFYSVMNEPNSILQRVIRKLQLLDAVDEAAGSGKLDLIIQLPYTIKTETRKQQAENRRDQIEAQLKGSKYGIAYTDGTERITQLNRPAENNMLKQIEYLMGQLYSQLGLDETIFNGTANEATTLNYRNRTLEPILRAFSEAMTRTFLTKTARTQGQTVDFLMDPFKLLPLSELATIADKFSRNEILSSNEIRALIGFTPVEDPRADMLINSNMPQEGEPAEAAPPTSDDSDESDEDLLDQPLTGAEIDKLQALDPTLTDGKIRKLKPRTLRNRLARK